MTIITRVMFTIFLFLGSRLFKYVDICSPDKSEVLGITFSNYEGYINKVGELE